jgi:hypothetical protein
MELNMHDTISINARYPRAGVEQSHGQQKTGF